MEEEKIWQPGRVSTQTHPDDMPLMGLSLSLEASNGKSLRLSVNSHIWGGVPSLSWYLES